MKYVMVQFNSQDYRNLCKASVDGFIEYASGGKLYAYYTDLDVQEDDLAVVQVAQAFFVVRVKSVHDGLCDTANKWIVDVVDLTGYKNRLERAKRLQEVRNRLEARAAQITEIQKYEILAKIDPSLSESIEEYKALMLGDTK